MRVTIKKNHQHGRWVPSYGDLFRVKGGSHVYLCVDAHSVLSWGAASLESGQLHSFGRESRCIRMEPEGGTFVAVDASLNNNEKG